MTRRRKPGLLDQLASLPWPIKGRRYAYWQFKEIGGRKFMVYLLERSGQACCSIAPMPVL